jgi:hypothetical protein
VIVLWVLFATAIAKKNATLTLHKITAAFERHHAASRAPFAPFDISQAVFLSIDLAFVLSIWMPAATANVFPMGRAKRNWEQESTAVAHIASATLLLAIDSILPRSLVLSLLLRPVPDETKIVVEEFLKVLWLERKRSPFDRVVDLVLKGSMKLRDDAFLCALNADLITIDSDCTLVLDV